MAVSFVTSSQGTAITTSGGTVSAGVTAIANDVIFCGVVNRITGASWTNNGWTLVTDVQDANFNLGLFHRVAAGSEGSWTAPAVSSASNFQAVIGGVMRGAGTIVLDATTRSTQVAAATSPPSYASLSGGANGGAVVDVVGQNAGSSFTLGTHTETTDQNTGAQATRTTLATSFVLVTTNGSTPTGTITPSSTNGLVGVCSLFIPQAVVAGGDRILVQPPRRLPR